jgi:glyoxylase-like metal-dependent hydrolase (beta-lactamase superfamily II)
VAGIKERTGAKVLVHQSEAEYLEDGFMRIPKGTSPLYKFISYMGRKGPMERKIGGYDPVQPDVTFNDSMSLEPLGFDGKVIHTPGHTRGSSTLVLDDRALVGDAMFNLSGNYYPGFANDEETLMQTWKQLLELDVKWYYPSHGRRIEKSNLVKYIKRKKIVL